MILRLPPGGLLILVGPGGAGKSTFAARHFGPTQVLSSDAMRAMVADDANDQSATEAAFALLHSVLGMRLAGGRLSVVDATNLEGWARRPLVAAARRHGRPAAALILALPVDVCLERNAARSDRRLPAATIRRQHRRMLASVGMLAGEGFDPVWTVSDTRELDAARVEIA